MRCPDCQGKKFIVALSRFKTLKCYRCSGTGEVPDETVKWVEIGNKMKKMRRDQKMCLREFCKKHGLNTVEMSKMERGWIEPDIELYKKNLGEVR